KLRAFLNVDCWQLFGGSWGSTLALIYAQNHQSRVLSLILRGIFLLRMQELEWFYQKGCNWIFPEAYDQLVAPLSAAERNDVISAYYDRLRHPDEAVRARAAKGWSAWEAATMSLNPMRGRTDLFESEQSVLAFARIEAHYFKHAGFMSHDGQVLHQVPRMAHLPGTLVHGRYDVITPLRNALDLAAVWPAANLQIVERAGHAMSEVGITSALLAATRHHQQYATRPDPELGSVGSSAS
ncbi:MAG: alpha/beta fold hydrolase, partial [Pseudomonadota bacterium]